MQTPHYDTKREILCLYTLPEANIAPGNTRNLEDEFPFEKAT